MEWYISENEKTINLIKDVKRYVNQYKQYLNSYFISEFERTYTHCLLAFSGDDYTDLRRHKKLLDHSTPYNKDRSLKLYLFSNISDYINKLEEEYGPIEDYFYF